MVPNRNVIPIQTVPIATPPILMNQHAQHMHYHINDNRMIIFKPKNVQTKPHLQKHQGHLKSFLIQDISVT